jgi:DNA-binding NarL/FixJ family response regulator
VALVARGLTNRQIAQELSISERTAGNHVAKILRKLELRSRAQIGRWAADRQLRMPHPDLESLSSTYPTPTNHR